MLTNAQMKAGRFAKLARGRRLIRWMNGVWDRGGAVWFSTMTARTKIPAKSREAVKMDSAGSVYVRRGKHWDCIDFCAFGASTR